MLKVECRYRAKLELIESLLHTCEDDNSVQSVDDIILKLKKSYWFYRNQLSQLED